MTNFRLGRLGFGALMTAGALGTLWSCDSGHGDDSSVPTAGQSAVAGSQSLAGSSSGGASAGGAANGAAGGPVVGSGGAVSGMGGSGTGGSGTGGSGTGGASAANGGTSGAAGSGQSGASSMAGGGAGGKGAAGSSSMGGSTSAAGGMTGSAGSGPLPLPAITGGTQGFTTRYWDCCKPSCGGSKFTCSQQDSPDNGSGSNACSGGNGYMCWSFAPFVDPANKYVAYAFAASNVGCGGCYELQFTGKSGCGSPSSCPANATALSYNTLFVQVTNSGSDVAANQFDLQIPGGGVGLFNACSKQWGVSDLGATDGGFLKTCNGSASCATAKCSSVFAGKPELLAGCNWLVNWLGAADNPQVTYKKVTCPKQLSDKSGMGG